MSELLDALSRDHVDLAKLLSMLADQQQVLRDGGTPDYDLLSDIIDYLHRYPDRIHHPLENLLYQAAVKRCSQADSDKVINLMEEHDKLTEMTDRLRHVIGAVIADKPVSREQLADQINGYVTAQQRHMRCEEDDVFPMIQRTLQDKHWAAIRSHLPRTSDPLSSPTPDWEEFQVLYERIARGA